MLRKNLEENDGQFKGMAEASERMMLFDVEDVPIKTCSPVGPFSIEACSSPCGDSQTKLSSFELRLITLGSGGSLCPSQKYRVTYDFLVLHIKAFQKSLGDRPKCGQALLQTSMKIFVHPQTNVKYENRIFTITRLIHAETQQIGCLHPCFHGHRI